MTEEDDLPYVLFWVKSTGIDLFEFKRDAASQIFCYMLLPYLERSLTRFTYDEIRFARLSPMSGALLSTKNLATRFPLIPRRECTPTGGGRYD